MTEPTSALENFVVLTSDIVTAYVSHNKIDASDLPALIATVHDAMKHLGTDEPKAPAVLIPAVPIRKSVTPDYIICLDDGKHFKVLKRHLAANLQMTPDQYRAKWGLPPDYPMVASNYAKTRSALAKANGLGRKPKVSANLPPKRKRARTLTGTAAG